MTSGPRAYELRHERLFNGQLQRLHELVVPPLVIELLCKKRHAVLARARNARTGAGRLPFVPVIPPAFLSMFSQAELLKIEGKAGCCKLDPAQVVNGGPVPESPYFIVNIADGTFTAGLPPVDARRQFTQEGRLGMNVFEGLALCLHSDVLSSHGVLCIASSCRLVSCKTLATPALYVGDFTGQPVLRWAYENICDRSMGNPSYTARV